MLRHLATLTLALVIAAAPSALIACELMCSGHDGETGAAGAGHTAHACHEAQSTEQTSLSGGVHECGHVGGLPESSAKQPSPSAPLPAVAIAISFDPAAPAAKPLQRLLFASGPPNVPAPITPLRI